MQVQGIEKTLTPLGQHMVKYCLYCLNSAPNVYTVALVPAKKNEVDSRREI